MLQSRAVIVVWWKEISYRLIGRRKILRGTGEIYRIVHAFTESGCVYNTFVSERSASYVYDNFYFIDRGLCPLQLIFWAGVIEVEWFCEQWKYILWERDRIPSSEEIATHQTSFGIPIGNLRWAAIKYCFTDHSVWEMGLVATLCVVSVFCLFPCTKLESFAGIGNCGILCCSPPPRKCQMVLRGTRLCWCQMDMQQAKKELKKEEEEKVCSGDFNMWLLTHSKEC